MKLNNLRFTSFVLTRPNRLSGSILSENSFWGPSESSRVTKYVYYACYMNLGIGSFIFFLLFFQACFTEFKILFAYNPSS